jgi:hypothetical protein
MKRAGRYRWKGEAYGGQFLQQIKDREINKCREKRRISLSVMENKRGRESTDRGAGRRSGEKRLGHGITNGR